MSSARAWCGTPTGAAPLGGLGKPLHRLGVVHLHADALVVAEAQVTLKSAQQGYHRAEFLLGECYENGYGVEKDLEKAVELYTRAHKGTGGGDIPLLVGGAVEAERLVKVCVYAVAVLVAFAQEVPRRHLLAGGVL